MADMNGCSDLTQITAALDCVASSSSPADQRLQAYYALEQLKSQRNFSVGLDLIAASDRPLSQRHFGAHVVEHCIKCGWKDLSAVQQLSIKATIFDLVKQLPQETVCKILNDSLARCIVEIAKREWPQCWAVFGDECVKTAMLGVPQADVVVRTWTRLIEDICVLQNLPAPSRRREIYNAICHHIEQFVKTATTIGEECASPTNTTANYTALFESILTFYSNVLEWVPIVKLKSHLHSGLSQCFQLLSSQNDTLRLLAAECLLQFASRKGKTEERAPILELFEDASMRVILVAAQQAADRSKAVRSEYVFLKSLCQVLQALGSQLSTLWYNPESKEPKHHQMIACPPPNFDAYLQSVVACLRTPSVVLQDLAATTLFVFSKHPAICTDPTFREMCVLPLSDLVRVCLLRNGYPSKNDCDRCLFARMDFDDDDQEFSSWLGKLRMHIKQLLLRLSLRYPVVFFDAAVSHASSSLGVPHLDLTATEVEGCEQFCNSTLVTLANKGLLQNAVSREQLSNAARVCEAVLMPQFQALLEAQRLVVANELLSVISDWTGVLRAAAFDSSAFSSALLTIITRCIWPPIMRFDGLENETESRLLRHHAVNMLTKLSQTYPTVLLPYFDELYTTVCTATQLTRHTRNSLLAILATISECFEGAANKQTQFLEEVVRLYVKNDLMSTELQQAIADADSGPTLMRYCGLLASDSFDADIYLDRRNALKATLEFLRDLLRGSVGPKITRFLDDILPVLFGVLRAFHQFYLPSVRTMLGTTWTTGLDLTKAESDSLVSLVCQRKQPDNEMPPAELQNYRASIFFHACLDSLYVVVGRLTECRPDVIYNRLVYIENGLLACAANLSDYRFQKMLKLSMRPFYQSVPSNLVSSQQILVIYSVVLSNAYQRLSNNWKVVLERAQTERSDSTDTGESGPLDENMYAIIVFDELTRQLTREVLMTIQDSLCFSVPSVTSPKRWRGHQQNGETPCDDGEEMEEGEPGSSGGAPSFVGGNAVGGNSVGGGVGLRAALNLPFGDSLQFTEFGKSILVDPNCLRTVLVVLVDTYKWKDTLSLVRSTPLIKLVIVQLLATNSCTVEIATGVFQSVLWGLHAHGQHDNVRMPLVGLSLYLYEEFYPRFTREITDLMVQIPNVTQAEVLLLNDKLSGRCTQPGGTAQVVNDKNRRQFFLKTIQPIIEAPIAQQFRIELQLPNLPPLKREMKTRKVAADADDLGGLALLFADR